MSLVISNEERPMVRHRLFTSSNGSKHPLSQVKHPPSNIVQARKKIDEQFLFLCHSDRLSNVTNKSAVLEQRVQGIGKLVVGDVVAPRPCAPTPTYSRPG